MTNAELPPFLIIGRKEFLNKFQWAVPGIAEHDVRETLTQVVEVLSNRGTIELLLLNNDYAILDLNRMLESAVSMTSDREVQWQKAAHQLAVDFLDYLKQVQLLDETGWFHYLLTDLTPTSILFEYFPF